jgi:serine/threonine protein kinase
VQKSSGKDVAVKLLREGPLADDAARSRLQREVAVLAALKHPNIISVIDHGVTREGLDYIVMDFVNGKPLYELIQAQSDPLESCPPLSGFLKIFTRICAAMHAAHLHGIVHRDLCPSNILIDAQAEPHILDFGLARTAFDQFIGGGPSKSSTGQFIGKPQYASPEQARGEPDKIDIRTDVYALGIILYQILTRGEFPYTVTGNLVEVLGNIIHQPPIPPSKQIGSREIQKRNPGEALAGTRYPAGVTRVLEAIVMKAIEKDPQNRYQSAGELGHDIENYLAGKPTVAHRESMRFDAPALPLEFTQWRIVLAGTAIILTVCVVAAFHFIDIQSFVFSTPQPESPEQTAPSFVPGGHVVLGPPTISPAGSRPAVSVGPLPVQRPGVPGTGLVVSSQSGGPPLNSGQSSSSPPSPPSGPYGPPISASISPQSATSKPLISGPSTSPPLGPPKGTSGSVGDKPKILQAKQWIWKGSRENYAKYSDLDFEVGIGAQPDGWGYGDAGIEAQNVRKIKISVDASPQFNRMDDNSFAGFMVDYHTMDGYTTRAALSIGMYSKNRWAKTPVWGKFTTPDRFIELGREKQYNLDLNNWAPDDWDGKVWFIVTLQNTGVNTRLKVQAELIP